MLNLLLQNQSFSRLGARIWNKVPEYLKSKPKQSLKKHLRTELLQSIVHEGIYVDVYTLADKLFLYQKLNIFFINYIYSLSFLGSSLIQFLSFVYNNLFLSLCINFPADMNSLCTIFPYLLFYVVCIYIYIYIYIYICIYIYKNMGVESTLA